MTLSKLKGSDKAIKWSCDGETPITTSIRASSGGLIFEMKMGSECHSEHEGLERPFSIGLDGLGMIIDDGNLAPGHIVLGTTARNILSLFRARQG